jgi:hypothetical protein
VKDPLVTRQKRDLLMVFEAPPLITIGVQVWMYRATTFAVSQLFSRVTAMFDLILPGTISLGRIVITHLDKKEL